MERFTQRRWLKWAGVVFAAQLIFFGAIHFFLIGAPYWAELPYLPFQSLFVNILGQFWPLGLILGVVVGTLVYSCVVGFFLAWMFRSGRSSV